MNTLFSYLIFPGLLFSAAVGLMACWLDRKITARLQWRVGPPWHQNFTDILKLSGRQIIIPEGAGMTFLVSPCLGLLSAAFAVASLGRCIISPGNSFGADLIVLFYLLTIPAIAMIIGASSSRNPLASVGASREIKSILAYELPFILAIIVVIIKSKGALEIGQIIQHQMSLGSIIFSPSGGLAFIIAILCIQAKLGLGLFDTAECDQELMCGTLIEYSGLPLALFKLTKAIMLYGVLLFIIVLFLGRDLTPVFLIAKYLMLLIIIILTKNTNPRLRIDQILRFFWGIPVLAGGLAIILAVLGL